MNNWTKLADQKTIEKTIEALKISGINAVVAENGQDAKNKALELIPKGAEVFTMTSQTLEATGIAEDINESGRYDAVRPKLYSTDSKLNEKDKQKMGATPEYTLGSVHAVTEDGKVVIASNTGSQLAAYVYGASHVVWVVGAQKIVNNLDDAFKRIYEYVLPLESERARKAYGVDGSNVSKLLIIDKEVNPGRINMIIVKEVLGF